MRDKTQGLTAYSVLALEVSGGWHSRARSPFEHRELFESLCKRENVPVAFVGVVTGDGHIKLVDRKTNTTPVDLPLELVLGKMPKKVPSAALAARATQGTNNR